MTPDEKDELISTLQTEKAWVIQRIEEELKQYGLRLEWADGGGGKCPSGWHRNPYIVALSAEQRATKPNSFLCKMGLHKAVAPRMNVCFNHVTVTSFCSRCGKTLLMDSQGNWF